MKISKTLSILFIMEEYKEDSNKLKEGLNELIEIYDLGDLDVNNITSDKFLKLLPYITDQCRGDFVDELKISTLNNLFRSVN